MGKSGRKWYRESLFRAAVTREEEPVEFRTDTPKISPNETKTTEIATVFTSLVTAVAVAAMKYVAPITGKTHVSRKSPSSRGRQRAPQSARGIQAPDRRELWNAILHHELGRQECSSVSHGGVGGDRAQAGSLSTFNPTKKKLLKRMSYYGQTVEFDGQGRLLLPQMFRESADFKGEVAVRGR